MIPEAEGDSTPLGQRPLCVSTVIFRIRTSVRSAHIQDWFYSGVPRLIFSVLGRGVFG